MLEEVLKRFPDWEVDTANARMAPSSVVRGWARCRYSRATHAGMDRRPDVTSYLGLDTDRERLTFGGFIADFARRYGDREALIFGDRRLTFRAARARRSGSSHGHFSPPASRKARRSRSCSPTGPSS